MGLNVGASACKQEKDDRKDFRAGLIQEFDALLATGMKILGSVEDIHCRLFGPRTSPEKTAPEPPIGPESSLVDISCVGLARIRSKQHEAADILLDIQNRL